MAALLHRGSTGFYTPVRGWGFFKRLYGDFYTGADREQIRNGRLKAVKRGRRVLISVESVQDWLHSVAKQAE
jgi:hypothetical protein